MPRSYDLNPVSITHHPTQRIDTAIGKLPPFDIQQIIDGFLTALKDLIGIDLTGIRDFLENMFGSIDWSNLPDAGDVWQFVVSTFILPIIDIVGQIGDALNAVLAPIFGGIDFNDLPTPAEVWQTVIDTLMLPLNLLLGPGSALNAANLFGRIGMPQFGSGVPIMALTTAVPNELEPFTALSVPSEDGWSFNASEDAAQVVCDGTPKALYLKSGVIKVEVGQPLDTSIDVKYSGITSGAGQTIRYVLETFTTPDGTGTATPVVVGAVSNPSGTITTPVTLGDSSWDIPAGVQSVRPALQTDELITAGTVFWLNTPELYKKLLGVLSGGLAQAIQDRIDDLAALINSLLTDPASVIGTLAANMVDGLEDFWDAITAKTVNLTSGGFFDAAKLQNITGTISQTLVTGLTSSLSTLNTFIQNVIDAILTALRGVPIVGGVIADIIEDVTGLKETADSALSDAATAQSTANQIVEDTNAGWTGGPPSGTPTAVYDTITQIRDAVSGVYTVEIKTTSGTWTNPGGIVEFWAICIGSGTGGGGAASAATTSNAALNGVAGAGGIYLAQQINPADLGSTESYVVPTGGVGAAGSANQVPNVGSPGGAASFGSHATSSAAASAIGSLVGYYNADASQPGKGGNGGQRTTSGSATNASGGADTPLASGGDAGIQASRDGGAGGSASLTGQTRCGGGGGGGGAANASGVGGKGGAGGFPGGGGGGGGGGYTGSGTAGGAGGNGGNGAIVLLYR